MKTYFAQKTITALLLLAPAFLFTACDDEALRGKGDSISLTRPVGAFDEISMGGDFEVYLTQGPAKDILLEGQENILNELSTQVRDHKLIIKYDRNRVKAHKPVRIYITTPELTEIEVSGSNTVRGLTDWDVNDFEIEASGSNTIDLNLKSADEIKTQVSGSANINLNGDANDFDIQISGSGKIKAFGLTTKTADVNVSGSGRCELTVTNHLKAKISGSGNVQYRGNPTVDTSISGSGRVTKAD
ncbi:MAG: head GIN domain-containing protein [Adhaeribacter sp.]